MGPSATCDRIVQSIKQSNLHFMLNENAFSVNIKIRKKFIREEHVKTEPFYQNRHEADLESKLEKKQVDCDKMKVANDDLKEANRNLHNELEHLRTVLEQMEVERNIIDKLEDGLEHKIEIIKEKHTADLNPVKANVSGLR